jgi:hypothetical protein
MNHKVESTKYNTVLVRSGVYFRAILISWRSYPRAYTSIWQGLTTASSIPPAIMPTVDYGHTLRLGLETFRGSIAPTSAPRCFSMM